MSDLVLLLSNLYDEPAEIRLALRRANLRPGSLDLTGSADAIWDRVVEEAWKQDRLEEVIEAASSDYERFREELLEGMQDFVSAKNRRFQSRRAPEPAVTAPGAARIILDRLLPGPHSFLTRSGTLPQPAELRELSSYLRALKAQLEHEFVKTTYLPLSARITSGGPNQVEELAPDPFVAPIHQVILHIIGRSQGGESASAQIAALSRRSRVVGNLLKLLDQTPDPLILLGEPGSGKTMTLKQAALVLAARESRRVFPRLPVYVRVGEFHVSGREPSADDVRQFVRRSLPPAIRERFDDLEYQGRLVIFFDGLDEMSRERYNEHTRALSLYAGSCPSKTLFSCRVTDFSPEFEHQQLVLLPFNQSQVAQYLKKYILAFPVRIDGADWDLKRLARHITGGELPVEADNPFVLWLLTLYVQQRHTWPASRVDLLQYFNDRNYQRKMDELPRGEGPLPDMETAFAHWSRFAYTVTLRNRGPVIPVAELAGGQDPADVQEMIRAGRVCGVLKEARDRSGVRLARFEHHRFQEFFTARHIHANRIKVDWLDKLDAPRWQETLLNLILMGDSSDIVQTLSATIRERVLAFLRQINDLPQELLESEDLAEEALVVLTERNEEGLLSPEAPVVLLAARRLLYKPKEKVYRAAGEMNSPGEDAEEDLDEAELAEDAPPQEQPPPEGDAGEADLDEAELAEDAPPQEQPPPKGDAGEAGLDEAELAEELLPDEEPEVSAALRNFGKQALPEADLERLKYLIGRIHPNNAAEYKLKNSLLEDIDFRLFVIRRMKEKRPFLYPLWNTLTTGGTPEPAGAVQPGIQSQVAYADEAVLADRVELTSRILRQAGTASELVTAGLLPAFRKGVAFLAAAGNPVTQVKMIRACQNVPQVNFIQALQNPLHSPVGWVRSQALLLIGSSQSSARAVGANVEMEIGVDLANLTFPRRFGAYWRAARAGKEPRYKKAILGGTLAFVFFLLLLLGAAGGMYAAARLAGPGWLASYDLLAHPLAAAGFGLLALLAFLWALKLRPDRLALVILGIYGGLIVWLPMLYGVIRGDMNAGGFALIFALVFTTFFQPLVALVGFGLHALALAAYQAGVLRKISAPRSFRRLCASAWNAGYRPMLNSSFLESKKTVLMMVLWGLGAAAFSVLLPWLTFAYNQYLLPALELLTELTGLPFSPLVNGLILIAVIALGVYLLISSFRKKLADALVVLAGIGFGLLVLGIYFLLLFKVPWALLARPVAILVSVLLALLLLWLLRNMLVDFFNRIRTMWFRFNLRNIDRARWIDLFGSEDAHFQADLLAFSTPQELRLSAEEFLALLKEVEPLLKPDPAASAYWEKRAQVEEILRQARQG